MAELEEDLRLRTRLADEGIEVVARPCTLYWLWYVVGRDQCQQAVDVRLCGGEARGSLQLLEGCERFGETAD